VDVYDVFPDMQELLSSNVDVVAFSALSVQYPGVSCYAKQLRENFSGIIIIGGIHLTLTKILPVWADIGILGEGEETFRELLSTIVTNGIGSIDKVRGLIVRRSEAVVFTAERPYIKELDIIPIPALHKIDIEPSSGPTMFTE
jgi:radical SAM superfamily enzyme YgiQ (UPF0313 family)